MDYVNIYHSCSVTCTGNFILGVIEAVDFNAVFFKLGAIAGCSENL